MPCPSPSQQNDLPNVAALRSLVRGLLALPVSSGLLTPAQRAAYTALSAILPLLPVDSDGTYNVAQVVSHDAGHNSEGCVAQRALTARVRRGARTLHDHGAARPPSLLPIPQALALRLAPVSPGNGRLRGQPDDRRGDDSQAGVVWRQHGLELRRD